MEYDIKTKTCPCCSGTGTQYNNVKGLRVMCPACMGTGKVTDHSKRTGGYY